MLLKNYKELKYKSSQNLLDEKCSTRFLNYQMVLGFFSPSKRKFWRKKNTSETHMGNTARGVDE